jgi:hypothetical protein
MDRQNEEEGETFSSLTSAVNPIDVCHGRVKKLK